MRIPQYDNQVNAPNAPQFNNTPDLVTDNLSSVLNGLGEVQKVMEREKEEAQKTAFFQADTSIKMELATAKHDLLEKIKNGGSYADAEAQYQKAHDAAIAKYSSVFDQDKSGNTKLRSMAEYQAEGLQNIMQIRDTVTSRRRSDTSSSASLRMEQLKRDYALAETPEQRQAALSAMSGTMASLSSTGIITGAEGKSKLTGVIQGAEADRLLLFAQNNADNPKAVLDEVERSKNNLSVDNYISMRGSALNAVEVLGTVDKVTNFMNDPSNHAPPKQQDVDVAFTKYLTDNAETISQDQAKFESDVINLSVQSGQIPSAIRSQADSFLSMYRQDMSKEHAAAVAQSARIVVGVSDRDAMIRSNKFDKSTIAKSNLIMTRIDAGMSEYDAVSSVMSQYDDEVAVKAYNSGRTSILTEIRKGKADIPFAGEDARSRYVDLVAESISVGASLPDAKSIAEKQLKKEYSEFNGVDVANAADKVPVNGVFYEKKDYIAAANKKYIEVTGEAKVPDGIKVVLQGDRETQRLIQIGETPSFPIMLYPEDDRPIPLFDKKGMPVRVIPDPTFKKVVPKTYLEILGK